MRTHYLDRLPISGREKALALEPNFDFYRAKRVLKLDVDFDGELPCLHLDAVYEGDTKRYRLKLVFEGVRELVLPEMSPLLFIPELEIEDIRHRMMQGLNFEAISHFERAFKCTCSSIEVLEFRPI